MRSTHIVGSVDEMPPGSYKFVQAGKFGIGVYNVDGEFRAVTNYCPHRGGPLCVGRRYPVIDSSAPYEFEVSGGDEILKCPWHGWEFDLRDGESEVGKKRIRTHKVRVEDGTVYLEGV